MATPWSWLTDNENEMVANALLAVREGPFVRWPRLSMLADPALIDEVAAAWPEPTRDADDVVHVVGRALNAVSPPNPHLAQWHWFFVAPPLDVRDFTKRWERRHGRGLAVMEECVGADLEPVEIDLAEAVVQSFANRLIEDFAVEFDNHDSLYLAADEGRDEPLRLQSPPGNPTTWFAEPVLVQRRAAIRIVHAVVELHAEGTGPTDLSLEFRIDAGGDPQIVLQDFHVL